MEVNLTVCLANATTPQPLAMHWRFLMGAKLSFLLSQTFVHVKFARVTLGSMKINQLQRIERISLGMETATAVLEKREIKQMCNISASIAYSDFTSGKILLTMWLSFIPVKPWKLLRLIPQMEKPWKEQSNSWPNSLQQMNFSSSKCKKYLNIYSMEKHQTIPGLDFVERLLMMGKTKRSFNTYSSSMLMIPSHTVASTVATEHL
jgi:hypothetical protein